MVSKRPKRRRHNSAAGGTGKAFISGNETHLVAAITKQAHFPAALDFPGNGALVFGATTGLFSGQDLILTAHEAA